MSNTAEGAFISFPAADMVLSDKSLSYDTVIDAFRFKALEDVSASIVRDYLDD